MRLACPPRPMMPVRTSGIDFEKILEDAGKGAAKGALGLDGGNNKTPWILITAVGVLSFIAGRASYLRR